MGNGRNVPPQNVYNIWGRMSRIIELAHVPNVQSGGVTALISV